MVVTTATTFFFLQDGSFATEDMFGFLTDGDFPALGKRPNTWHDCVIGLRDEMANHVVIQSAASLFVVNIHIIHQMQIWRTSRAARG